MRNWDETLQHGQNAKPRCENNAIKYETTKFTCELNNCAKHELQAFFNHQSIIRNWSSACRTQCQQHSSRQQCLSSDLQTLNLCCWSSVVFFLLFARGRRRTRWALCLQVARVIIDRHWEMTYVRVCTAGGSGSSVVTEADENKSWRSAVYRGLPWQTEEEGCEELAETLV